MPREHSKQIMEAVNVISVRQTRPGPLRRSADGLVDYLVCRPSLGVHRSDARLEKRETLVPAHGSRKPLSARLPRASGVTQASAVDVLADTVPPGGSSPYDAEYRAAIEAVRLASVLCQAVQSQLKNAEKVEKDDSSPVTVADYGAQALVAWSLRRSLPHQRFSMVAEEDSNDLRAPEGAAMLQRITDLVNATLAQERDHTTPLSPEDVIELIDHGASEGGPTGRHWVLDPIDGTRGFVGMRQYAVCLGLLEDGDVKLGVLGCPNLPQWAISDVDCDKGQACRAYDEVGIGCVFAARKGCGAFAGPLFHTHALPHVRAICDDSLAPEEVRFMESFEKRHSNHSISAAVAEEIGLELPSLRLDSQAKYGALARGDASIFMRFPPDTYREKIWDHCAGAIIVTESGGCITDAKGNPLDFSQGRYFPYLNGGLIAATPSMHKAIMAALRKIRGEE